MHKKKKIIMISVILLLFLIPLMLSEVIPEQAFDNVKTYKEPTAEQKAKGEYGTVAITDNFGLGKTFAEYTLTRNTAACLTHCEAEGTVTFKTGMKLFDHIFYQDYKGTLTDFPYQLYILNYTEWYEDVPTYGEVCKSYDVANLNLTTGHVANCSVQKTGVNKNQLVNSSFWQEYKGEILLDGTYRWKFVSSKAVWDSVDWFPNVQGLEAGNYNLTEWAWFNASFGKRHCIDLRYNGTNAAAGGNIPYRLKLEFTAGDVSNCTKEIRMTFCSTMNKTRCDGGVENEDLRAKVWQENYSGGYCRNATVYGIVNTNMTVNNNITVCAYYNSSTAGYEDPARTDQVLYYDNFETGVLDRATWDVVYETVPANDNQGQVNVTGDNRLNMLGDGVNNARVGIFSKYAYSFPFTQSQVVYVQDSGVARSGSLEYYNAVTTTSITTNNFYGPYGVSYTMYTEGVLTGTSPLIDDRGNSIRLAWTVNSTKYASFRNNNPAPELTGTRTYVDKKFGSTQESAGKSAYLDDVIVYEGEFNRTYYLITNGSLITGIDWGEELVNVTDVPPTQGRPLINSTFGTNSTNENITAFPQQLSDDVTTVIYDWKLYNQSVLLLNLPFDVNISSVSPNLIRDYSSPAENFTLGNNNTNFRPTWTPQCVSGGCYTFNSSTQVIIANSYYNGLNTTVNFSVEIWYKYKSVPSAGIAVKGTLFSNGQLAINPINYHVLFQEGGVSDFLVLAATCSGSNKQFNYDDQKIYGVDDDTWTNFVLTYNGSWFDIYQNGTFRNSTFCGNLSGGVFPQTVGVGNNNFGSGFNGSLDEFKIWNLTLTPQQIRTNYNSSQPKYNLIHASTIGTRENWSVCTTVSDGVFDSPANCSIFLEIIQINRVVNMSINSTDRMNATNGTLMRFFDFETDSLSTHLFNETRWFVDNVERTALRNNSQITPENTSRGQVWIASSRVFHTGTGNPTDFKNSSGLLITDTVPEPPTQQFPNNNTFIYNATQNFNCTKGFDEDNDSLNIEFWFNRTGVAATLIQNATATEALVNFTSNNTFYWYCRNTDNASVSRATDNRTIVVDTARIRQVNESNPGTVPELSVQTFSLNLSLNNISVLSTFANFTYNKSSKALSSRNSTRGEMNFTTFYSTSFAVPDVDATTTLNYTWEVLVLLRNGTQERHVFNFSHNVFSSAGTICASNDPNVKINFTLRHEVNDTQLRGDFRATFTVFGGDRTINSTFSMQNITGNYTTFYFCYNASSYNQLTTDAIIQYSGVGGAGYDFRNYYLINYSLLNQTNISLYLLDIPAATGIQFTVQDPNTKPLPGLYIFVNRYDPGTNTFKTVSIGKSDDVGREFMFLRQQDALHQVIVQDYLNIRFVSNLFKFNGQTFTITISEDTIAELIDSYNAIGFLLTYSNATDNVTLTFNSPSPLESVCLRITQFTSEKTNNTFDTCMEGNAGTITSNLPDENGTYIATYYVHGSPNYLGKNLFVVKQGRILANVLGLDQIWISFLIVFIVAFSGLVTPAGPIVLGFIGFFAVWLLGLLNVPSSVVMSLGILAGLYLTKLKE